MKIRIFTFSVICFASVCFADPEWLGCTHQINGVGTANYIESVPLSSSLDAELYAVQYLPLFRDLTYSQSVQPAYTLGFSFAGRRSYIVSNIVTGVSYFKFDWNLNKVSQNSFPGSAFSLVLDLLRYSLVNSIADPYNYCTKVYTNSANNKIYFGNFQPLPLIANSYFCSADFRNYLSDRLSSIDIGVSNILVQAIGINDNLTSVLNSLSSLTPDWSVQSGLLNSQLFKGRYNSSMLPASLQNHFVSGAVLQPSDAIGTAYLNNWYNAFKNGTSDSFVDFWRMAGVSVSEDGEEYTYDSTANDLNFGNRTISLADYMGASPFQQAAYKASVNKATNTNSVQRIGEDIKKSLGSASRQLGSISNTLGTISSPRSPENLEKRQLDAEANAQAIKQALANNNNSLFNVHVNNWPDDGIKVNFDDQDLNIGFNASAGSAVDAVKNEIKNLVDDFRTWSGVEEGGNNLVIQDSIATNMGYIVGSLASLTNSYLSNTNTYPYGQYTAQQSTNDQNNARSYISSVQSELSRYNEFNAEDYISWGLSSYINPSDRSDWNALRLMCINARLPEYITLVIPSFGSFGPWSLRVPTAPAVRIVSVSRFCCRMVYLFVLLWIACWAFRRYRDVLDILRDAFGLKGPMQMS